jgi:hypothetical protein
MYMLVFTESFRRDLCESTCPGTPAVAPPAAAARQAGVAPGRLAALLGAVAVSAAALLLAVR